MNVSSQPPTTFYIDSAKIRHYLLNPNHPTGRPKAVFLTNCGFSLLRPDMLAIALLDHATYNQTTKTVPAVGGVKHIYEGPLQAPNGNAYHFRSVWIVRQGSSTGDFVSAYKI